MKYFFFLKQHIYFCMVFTLIQAVGTALAIFITGKAPLPGTAPFYELFFTSNLHETSFFTTLIIIIIISLVFVFSPFIRSFLIKHGYLSE